ncbi:MAG TPA: type II toxin-antitoxin system VapC family toxin [Thermoanaerobaculia bacterium]|nr:type II toxin-antitoxin system VapC family toxin [Thermoanaerobaculia bacterium]
MIVVDTSALIDSLCGPRRSLGKLTRFIEAGERLVLPAIALYEWLRGPRLPDELHAQEELFPRDEVAVFGAAEAAAAADLYRLVRSPRGREIDLAIAATALVREASLWTLNDAGFVDVPGISLV